MKHDFNLESCEKSSNFGKAQQIILMLEFSAIYWLVWNVELFPQTSGFSDSAITNHLIDVALKLIIYCDDEFGCKNGCRGTIYIYISVLTLIIL